MHPEDIKAGLRKTGTTVTSFATEMAVSQGMISRVIRSQARSRRIEAEIARRLKLPCSDLWPDRYPTQPSQVHHEH